MKRKFHMAMAMTLTAAMLMAVHIPAIASESYGYYHQEFTNISGTETRLNEGAQNGDMKNWTARYPSDGTFNTDESTPEGAYITQDGALRLQAKGTHKSAAEDNLPSASFDYSDFTGKDGNYTISFRMNIVSGNRVIVAVGKAPGGLANSNTAYCLTPQYNQKWQYNAGSNVDLFAVNASAVAKPAANRWYDVQMYINNIDKKFNVWVDGVQQKDSTTGSTDLSLNSNYAEDYINPSCLTFSISPSNSSSNAMILDIDDLKIMPGKYDLLHQNTNWNTIPGFYRTGTSGEKGIASSGARYGNDYSLLLGGPDTGEKNTSWTDYGIKLTFVNSSGTTAIDQTKPVVTELSFMPIEKVGQIYFTDNITGKAVSQRIKPSDLIAGQWNKVKMIYTPASASDTGKATSAMYLNGRRYYKDAVELDGDYLSDSRVNQIRLTVSCFPDDETGARTAENLNEIKCAVDDVRIYQPEDGIIAEEKYPTFDSISDWYAPPVETAARYGGVLFIPETGAELADIKNCSDANTEIRLFESDFSTPTETVSEGTKLVLVSETGVYAYYDIHISDFEISFTGDAVEDVDSGKVKDGALTASCTTTGNYGRLVLVQYNDNNQIIDIDIAGEASEGSRFTVTQTVKPETKRVTAFFWSDLDSIILPVMKASTLTRD